MKQNKRVKTYQVRHKDGLTVNYSVTAPVSFLKAIRKNKDVVSIKEI